MRFSLRSLLLITLVVALALMAGISTWEWRKTQTQLNDLQDKHGELVLRDKSRIHVRSKENYEGSLYKFEVFIPEGCIYAVSFGWKDIPPNGSSGNRKVVATLGPGEHVIRMDATEGQRYTEVRFRVSSPDDHSTSIGFSIDQSEWVDANGQSMEHLLLGVDSTTVIGAGPAITLLRKRPLRRTGESVADVDPEPTLGMLIELRRTDGK